MRILLVDDDRVTADALASTLESQHYLVDVAEDGEKALELLEAFPYDLLLLDVVLPKLDGITLCQKLRVRGLKMPILLLTARDNSIDKVRGLDAGADDYLSKPFDCQELLARIRTLLRRGTNRLLPILEWNELSLSPSTCQVTYKNEILNLTPTEYRLLELFLRNNRRVFSCSDLIEQVWSFDHSPSEETVRSHIKGLRMKMRTAGAPADLIETVYGLGYRLKTLSNQKSTAVLSANQNIEEQGENDRNSLGSSCPIVLSPCINYPGSNSPSQKEVTLKAIAEIWEKFKQSVFNQVEVLQNCATAIEAAMISEDLHQKAITEAHKLTGLLGTLGFAEGSQICRQIETLLRNASDLRDPNLALRLQESIASLKKVLQQPLPQSPQALANVKNSSGTNDRLISAQETISLSENFFHKQPLLLIVDEDLELAELLRREAIAIGLQIQVVSSLSMAREWLTHNHADAIVLDLYFPSTNENGLVLLEELNSSMPYLPAIVLSRRGDFCDRLEVARLGARAFLHKAIPPAQVLAAITQILEPEETTSAKILIVDDDANILNLLETLLKPWELKITTLKDPRLFWETLEKVLPDLLILDVQMPHLNGIELCQVVRNDPAWGGLPILFLTAHCDPDTVQKVFAAGADDFVSKPIVGPELVTRIVIRLERVRLLRQLAETDPLTRLANRNKLTTHLSQLILLAERTHLPLCFAILDLDNFKKINDEYGHGVGDTVLRWLGGFLSRSFRRHHDIVARWGGDEIAIVMYGIDKATAVQRLKDFLVSINRQEFTNKGIQLPITFSAGVAQYPDNGTDIQTLYRSADIALYQAKTSGRNQVIYIQSVNN